MTFDSIEKIRALAFGATMFQRRPVFSVKLKERSEVIILKYEVLAPGRVAPDATAQWAGKLMSKATGNKSTKVNGLTVAEIQALGKVPEEKFLPDGTQKGAYDYLHVFLTNKDYFAYKMPFVDGLTDLGFEVVDDHKSEKWKKILAAWARFTTNDGNILYSLGKVVAGDLFNGNNDRIDGLTGDVQTQGNLLVAGSGAVVGLDFYEANSNNSDLRTAPSNDWPGKQLGSDAELGLFASKMLDGLNAKFQNGLSLRETEKIPMTMLEPIRKGLVDGAHDLRSYLQQRLRSGKPVTSGIMERMRILGWLTDYAAAPALKWTAAYPGTRQSMLAAHRKKAA